MLEFWIHKEQKLLEWECQYPEKLSEEQHHEGSIIQKERALSTLNAKPSHTYKLQYSHRSLILEKF